jgi:hypothetical protein
MIFRQMSLRYPGCQTGPDGTDGIRIQFGERMTLALGAAAFLFAVGHVVGLGSEKQVIRIDAGRVVAPWAIVEHEQSIGNRPIMEFPGPPMGSDTATILVTERSVVGGVAASSPEPARFGFPDLGEKPFDRIIPRSASNDGSASDAATENAATGFADPGRLRRKWLVADGAEDFDAALTITRHDSPPKQVSFAGVGA